MAEAERWFRNGDRRFPFFWETDDQPAGRWHGTGEGPVQYLADTPDGAWAEFVRHEEINDPGDLAGVSRSLWCVELELEEERIATPSLPARTLLGGLRSYRRCQAEARRLRTLGRSALLAPSAALRRGRARGLLTRGPVLVPAAARDGRVLALFGPRPHARGFLCVEDGRPPEAVVESVRPLRP